MLLYSWKLIFWDKLFLFGVLRIRQSLSETVGNRLYFYINIKIEKYPFLTCKFLFEIKVYERQCTCLRKDLTRSFFSDEVNNAVPALWSVCSSANVVSGWLFIDIEGVSTSRWLKSNHQIINVKNTSTTKNEKKKDHETFMLG